MKTLEIPSEKYRYKFMTRVFPVFLFCFDIVKPSVNSLVFSSSILLLLSVIDRVDREFGVYTV